MADNAIIGSGATTPLDLTIAADEVGGLKYQRVKISVGDDGTVADVGASNSLPVSRQAATATLANVSGSASSVTLQAANTARKGLVVVNDSTAILYVKFGSTASTTSFTYYLAGTVSGAPSMLELPGVVYTGIVTGIWASATGAARVTELT